ncbi:hypothetical protein [Flavobacterium sp. AJR]|nr:hypothetical protein [Flavobacterium sp. AJR]
MKTIKFTTGKINNEVKIPKVFKSLNEQQLESVVGGPITSRGTETTVLPG